MAAGYGAVCPFLVAAHEVEHWGAYDVGTAYNNTMFANSLDGAALEEGNYSHWGCRDEAILTEYHAAEVNCGESVNVLFW